MSLLPMDKQNIRELLDKYLMETISPEETGLLFRLMEQPDHQQEIEKFIDGYFDGDDEADAGNPALREEIQARLRETIRQPERTARIIHFRRNWTWAAAAIMFVVLTGGIIYLYRSGRHADPPAARAEESVGNDLAPGGNKAVLTLANGHKVVLDSASNGLLSQQGPVKIMKLDNGKLAYSSSLERAKEMVYNTLSTPPGGQYQLTLSDGTKVWLDAASSITYPADFIGAERTVKITGQAYLEVAKNEKLPFIVEKGEMKIRVLGTQFNVNAYEDETAIRTTLVEGAVSVVNSHAMVTLHPGQQAQLSREGEITMSRDPDVDAVLAWKAGMFQFRSTDIETVMRQVARWYDVTVQFEGDKVKQRFNGAIPRTVSAANMFKVLELAGGVHFKIEGKKVVVMP